MSLLSSLLIVEHLLHRCVSIAVALRWVHFLRIDPKTALMSPLSTMSINILCWWTRKDTFLAPVLIGSDIWLFSIHQMVGGAPLWTTEDRRVSQCLLFFGQLSFGGAHFDAFVTCSFKGLSNSNICSMNLMFLPTQIVETSHHSQNLSFLQLHEVWWSRKNWQAWHPLLPPGSSLILLRKSDWGYWQTLLPFCHQIGVIISPSSKWEILVIVFSE